MKKIFVGLFVLMVSFVTLGFSEVKIGVVNMQRALDESDSGKAAVEKMKAEFSQMQDKINKETELLKKMQEDINNQSSLLTEEAKQKKIEEYQKRYKDIQRLVSDSNEAMKKKEQQYVGKIAQDLVDLVEKMGKELNYDIVIEAKESGVLYSSKKLDLTDLLIERYNKEFNAKK